MLLSREPDYSTLKLIKGCLAHFTLWLQEALIKHYKPSAEASRHKHLLLTLTIS